MPLNAEIAQQISSQLRRQSLVQHQQIGVTCLQCGNKRFGVRKAFQLPAARQQSGPHLAGEFNVIVQPPDDRARHL